jgi:hypothetical protein
MNCAQHTDTAAVAYCCNCGKALCEVCKRDVQGTIFCEPCLAARVHGAAGGKFGSGAASYGPAGAPSRTPEDTSPGLALFLGFIPGVGAFYNGQFLKGFVHVMVFATLIWLTHHGMGAFAGILVPAWFFYMVFDAYTTAKARRYGMPIPDPLGLNQILEGRDGTFRQRVEQAGERLGTRVEYAAHNVGEHWQRAGAAAPGATASNFVPGGGAASSAAAQPATTPNAGPESTAYVGPQGTYSGPNVDPAYVDPRYVAPVVLKEREHSPVGAIVLIGLGLLFLLANLGWFSFGWISHFWPAVLIVIGLWLFIRRQRCGR